MTEDRTLMRSRWELATLAGRLRTLEAERDDWRARHDELALERDRARDLIRGMRRSRAYRIGLALVSLARPLARRLRDRPVPARREKAAPTAAAKALPTHVFVAIGLEPETLQSFTRSLAQRLLVNADHVPVVVTDCATFRLAQAPGVVLEYLPDAETWSRHRPDVPWDELLTERLARLFVDHGCVRTVVLDPDKPPTLAELLA